MSIKHAVLGLIAEAPEHGYGIRARFARRMGDLVELPPGRVYSVLRRLEAEGLVERHVQRVGRRTRKIYSVRPEGRRALSAWAEAQPPPLASLRDLALRLLALRFDPTATAAILRAWSAHERRVLELLEHHPIGEGLPGLLPLVRASTHATATRRTR